MDLTMIYRRVALPLVLLGLFATSADATRIRDDGRMFSDRAVSEAQGRLDRIERAYQVPVVLETVESLNGQDITSASLERAQRSGSRGIYILLDKQGKKLEVRDFNKFLGEDRRRAIRQAFTAPFQEGDFDAGLLQAVGTIDTMLAQGGGRLRPNPAGNGRAPAPARGGGGLSALIPIILGIVGILFVIRLLGGLFGSMGRPQVGQAPMGAPGSSGYGRGGGGFMSSLFGGIGGALAGNWLYDQFSGHHQDRGDTYSNPTDAGPADAGGNWGGGGEVGDWGGGGGGGDWGGGDGGGGDWGGGGDGGGSW